MSVLIKDMDMPKTCEDCPFHVYHSHYEFICVATPMLYPMNLANSKGIRKDWCPLSEAQEPCDDTISRQAAIDALIEEFKRIPTVAIRAKCTVEKLPPAQPYSEADIQKMQDLEQAEIQKAYELGRLDVEPPWVLCSERPPKDDTEVFVYLFDHPSPYIAWICDGCWFTEEFQVEKEDYPKAWMPLPEPYREEGEQDADVNT